MRGGCKTGTCSWILFGQLGRKRTMETHQTVIWSKGLLSETPFIRPKNPVEKGMPSPLPREGKEKGEDLASRRLLFSIRHTESYDTRRAVTSVRAAFGAADCFPCQKVQDQVQVAHGLNEDHIIRCCPTLVGVCFRCFSQGQSQSQRVWIPWE